MTLGHCLLQVTQILLCYSSSPVEEHGSREKNLTLLIIIYNLEPYCHISCLNTVLIILLFLLYENCCMWKFQWDCIFCEMTNPNPEKTVILRCAALCLQNYLLQISTFEWPEAALLQFYAVLFKCQEMWSSVDASWCLTRKVRGSTVHLVWTRAEIISQPLWLYLQFPSDRREKQSGPQ